MKRTTLLIAAVLCCCSISSQEVESAGNRPSLTLISRLEADPLIPVNGEAESEIGLAASAIYSVFEGSINEHLSYYVVNHWLSSDPASLYRNTFRSDNVSWVDYANLTYETGRMAFTVGKDFINIGTFELDTDDFDAHWEAFTPFGYNYGPTFQWGASAELFSLDGESSLGFQVQSSPFSEHPFQNGLLTWSLKYSPVWGAFSGLWSVNMIGYEKGYYMPVLALGNMVELGDVSLCADVVARGTALSRFLDRQLSASLSGTWTPSDRLEVLVKCGMEFSHDFDPLMDGADWELDGIIPSGIEPDRSFRFASAGIHYYPLGDETLRLHALAAVNNYSDNMALSFGATYKFDCIR